MSGRESEFNIITKKGKSFSLYNYKNMIKPLNKIIFIYRDDTCGLY